MIDRLKRWILHWLGGVTSEEVNRRRIIDAQQTVDHVDAATKRFNRQLQERKLEHERELEEMKKQHDLEIAKLKADVESLCTAAETVARELNELTLGSQASLAEVISELNELRNRIPAAMASQQPGPPVRVYRNFREFRGAVEGRPQQSIKIERTS